MGRARPADQALVQAPSPTVSAASGFDPSRGNGCSCRWCTYDRVFAEQIAKVSDPDARAVFEQLKEDWESAEHDASYWRNYWASEVNDTAQAIETRERQDGETRLGPQDESAVRASECAQPLAPIKGQTK